MSDEQLTKSQSVASDGDTVGAIYAILLTHFGPQRWWPVFSEAPRDRAVEAVIGAVLRQRMNWVHAEKAVKALHEQGLIDCRQIVDCPTVTLELLIRPAGFYHSKAATLQRVCQFFLDEVDGDPLRLQQHARENYSYFQKLRYRLLQIKGLGQETADCILLYGVGVATMVADNYAYRIAVRHGWLPANATYMDVKRFYCGGLSHKNPDPLPTFREAHALLVEVGKHYCRPRAKCENCPLRSLPHNPFVELPGMKTGSEGMDPPPPDDDGDSAGR